MGIFVLFTVIAVLGFVAGLAMGDLLAHHNSISIGVAVNGYFTTTMFVYRGLSATTVADLKDAVLSLYGVELGFDVTKVEAHLCFKPIIRNRIHV